MTRSCPRCQFPGPHTREPGAGPHTAHLVCGRCGRFVQWLSTKERPQDDAEVTFAQLSYLVGLGFIGTLPLTKREASRMIQTLLQTPHRGEASPQTADRASRTPEGGTL